ncbi:MULTISPECIES: host attachment protein [Bradyrhizobium]|uniref:Host attachment protein n=2 Tax=Bradyrhizobium elkanii TaxID=29448 RepID=A0A4U6S1D6_BRAEL|nr:MULTISPECIES: host attachment protein [Bradyrhizobium]MTV15457.1 host attachment protein [Bradyrhizobium sp. BR2003]TKV81329.1 host attachment protein [Bradyrhizobium elkanii]
MAGIPNNALVFVGDGRKALLLRNEGDNRLPSLKAEAVFEDQNQATHLQGTDRPGHFVKGIASGQRGAVEPTNWHELEEYRFTKRVARAAEEIVRSGKATALVIVAPPRTLAELRTTLHPDVKRHIIAEIPKDLTKLAVREIEKHVVEALALPTR